MTILETTQREPETLPLTQKHIDEGLKGNCNNCPVALALGEYFMAPTLVNVSNHRAWVGHQFFLIGDRLAAWISSFDWGHAVQPITIAIIKTPTDKVLERV